ncbi:MAG: dephospho-CoA kinase [Gemmataceae bacterium]|nr:dephospho-CoA kinase [Gemmataceae bacterium]
MTPFRHGPKPTVGLVGGIGAGKTTAALAFAARGGAVVDGDALGHAALADPAVRRRVLDRWGHRANLIRPDGSFDRRALAGIVFADPAERSALEAIVFPWIGEQARAAVRRAQADPLARFVVVDAAVMLEAGWSDVCDRIVYVDAPAEVRLSRVAARSGWTAADLAAREAAQWPAAAKLQQADAVIVNDAGPDRLQEQVDRLLTAWGLGPV